MAKHTHLYIRGNISASLFFSSLRQYRADKERNKQQEEDDKEGIETDSHGILTDKAHQGTAHAFAYITLKGKGMAVQDLIMETDGDITEGCTGR